MQAARMTSYGPPELLTVTEVPEPQPGAGRHRGAAIQCPRIGVL